MAARKASKARKTSSAGRGKATQKKVRVGRAQASPARGRKATSRPGAAVRARQGGRSTADRASRVNRPEPVERAGRRGRDHGSDAERDEYGRFEVETDRAGDEHAGLGRGDELERPKRGRQGVESHNSSESEREPRVPAEQGARRSRRPG